MDTIKSLCCVFIALASVFTAHAQPYYSITGVLSGANEVPANMSTATGNISGTYDEATGMVNLFVPFSGLSANATVSHIHLAEAGVNGSIIVHLTVTPATSGSAVGSFMMPIANEAAFLSGDTYINIHNSIYPGGEIRAQLVFTINTQPTYTISGTLSGLNEVPPNMSTATGNITGTYHQSTGIVNLSVPFSGLSANATTSHIHLAEAGVNGPIIVNLTVDPATSGNVVGSFNLPLMYEADFLSGGTYINIHNSIYPGGEIRAQLNIEQIAFVPTLSQWAYFTLILLFAIVGVVAVKKEAWNHA